MANELRIFDPTVMPHGPLSNHYRRPFRVGGEQWPSVTHYIYGAFLQTPLYVTALRRTQKTRDVKNAFHRYYMQELASLVRTSVMEAYTAKLEQDPAMAQRLLDTGNKPIYYMSDNSQLGFGFGESSNIIGKHLEQIRYSLTSRQKIRARQEKESAFEQDIYDAYTAWVYLRSMMHDKGNDLSEFQGMSITDILRHTQQTKQVPRVPEREAVMQLYKDGSIEEYITESIGKQGMLVDMVRGKTLRVFRRMQLRSRREVALFTHALYVVRNEYPDLRAEQHNQAIIEHMESLTVDESDSMERRIISLFEQSKLPPQLLRNIAGNIQYIDIPSEQDVLDAENKLRQYEVQEQIDVVESGELERTVPDETITMIVFQSYIESKILARGLPVNTETREEIAQQVAEKEDVQQRVRRRYEESSLSPDLMRVIRERIALAAQERDPLSMSVEELRQQTRATPASSMAPPTFETALATDETTVRIYDDGTSRYAEFAPASHGKFFTVQGRVYPTVTHYMTAAMLSHIRTIGTMQNAHTYLLNDPTVRVTGLESFVSPVVAHQRYEIERDHEYAYRIRQLASEALDAKFSDNTLQMTLMNTGNTLLLWGDNTDPLLGTGPRNINGENYVGKYLMYLREKFLHETTQATSIVSSDTVSTSLINDPILYAWMVMRLNDLCFTVSQAQRYVSPDRGITTEFVRDVLDALHSPCGTIRQAMSNTVYTPPDSALRHIRSCPGFERVSTETVELLWQYLTVMIGYLVSVLKNTQSASIHAVLNRTQSMVASSSKCIEFIQDDYDNCIASALMNIVSALSVLSRRDITEETIKSATDILLSRHAMNANRTPQEEQEIDNGMDDEQFLDALDDTPFSEFDDYGDISAMSTQRRTALESAVQQVLDPVDVEQITVYIDAAIRHVRQSPLSDSIKMNRINFFASQRRS